MPNNARNSKPENSWAFSGEFIISCFCHFTFDRANLSDQIKLECMYIFYNLTNDYLWDQKSESHIERSNL